MLKYVASYISIYTVQPIKKLKHVVKIVSPNNFPPLKTLQAAFTLISL